MGGGGKAGKCRQALGGLWADHGVSCGRHSRYLCSTNACVPGPVVTHVRDVSPGHAGWQRVRGYWQLPLASPLRTILPSQSLPGPESQTLPYSPSQKRAFEFLRPSHSKEVQRQDQAWHLSLRPTSSAELSPQHPKPQRPQDTFVTTVSSTETQHCSIKPHSPMSGAVLQEAQSWGNLHLDDADDPCRDPLSIF